MQVYSNRRHRAVPGVPEVVEAGEHRVPGVYILATDAVITGTPRCLTRVRSRPELPDVTRDRTVGGVASRCPLGLVWVGRDDTAWAGP